MNKNLLAAILGVVLVFAAWFLTQIPAVWAWITDPAWHWAIFVGGFLGLVDRVVKLSKWKGDDALWKIVKDSILGRK